LPKYDLALASLVCSNNLRKHLDAHGHHWKVLNHFHMSNMDLRSNQRWSATSTMTSQHHVHLDGDPKCQYLTEPCHSVTEWVRMMLHSYYAHEHHYNVLEHLIYVQYQYGCEKQSKVVYSVNHDITDHVHLLLLVTKNNYGCGFEFFNQVEHVRL
jgi:hypothetical protein